MIYHGTLGQVKQIDIYPCMHLKPNKGEGSSTYFPRVDNPLFAMQQDSIVCLLMPFQNTRSMNAYISRLYTQKAWNWIHYEQLSFHMPFP